MYILCQKVWSFLKLWSFAWLCQNKQLWTWNILWKVPIHSIYSVDKFFLKVILFCEESYDFPLVVTWDWFHHDIGKESSEYFISYVLFQIISGIHEYYVLLYNDWNGCIECFVVDVFEKECCWSKGIWTFLESWKFEWLWIISDIFHQKQKLWKWNLFRHFPNYIIYGILKFAVKVISNCEESYYIAFIATWNWFHHDIVKISGEYFISYMLFQITLFMNQDYLLLYDDFNCCIEWFCGVGIWKRMYFHKTVMSFSQIKTFALL